MQTINFYLDSYHPKPLSFDSRFALIAITVSFIGFLLFGWIQENQVDDLKQTLAARNQQSKQQLEQLSLINKELGSQSNIKNLQQELIASQKELSSYRKIITTFNMPITQKPIHFSQIMNDLSLHTVDSLWLTKISIQAHNLSLKGSTTKAEAIPVYVNKLKQANSLKRYFDELKIERPEDNKSSSQHLIKFELLNGRLIQGLSLNE